MTRVEVARFGFEQAIEAPRENSNKDYSVRCNPLAIEPGVLHPPQVVGTVDPDRDSFDLGV